MRKQTHSCFTFLAGIVGLNTIFGFVVAPPAAVLLPDAPEAADGGLEKLEPIPIASGAEATDAAALLPAARAGGAAPPAVSG